jgi:hypothetical protein
MPGQRREGDRKAQAWKEFFPKKGDQSFLKDKKIQAGKARKRPWGPFEK